MSSLTFSEASPREACLDAVRAGFAATFGGQAEGVFSAPGRVNLIGEHVDYQAGWCVPMAISQRAYVAARRTHDDRLRLASSYAEGVVEVRVSTLQPADLTGVWAAYLAGVPWALRDAHPLPPGAGLEIYLYSEVPAGAGLSSSAAIECATALAFNHLFGLGASDLDLIRAAISAENDFVGASTGGLDQSASVLCREGHALLLDCRDTSTQQVPWNLADQGLALLVIDTRSPHSLSDGQYNNRRAASELGAELLGVTTLRDYVDAGGGAAAAAAAVMQAAPAARADELARRVRHIVSEMERTRAFATLLQAGSVRENLGRLGELLNASHESLRHDYEVTCIELDVAVDAARASGAHGARMTGGGFGGSAIALVESDAALTVAQQVAKAYADHSLAAPQFFVVAPAEGARRED
ncbi:galactokinase [Micrococcales bacterium 31B]|nr:galactokinase [Micrococcales bacterium 31B]